MINFEEIITIFPQVLQTQIHNFSAEALQDLDQVLASLSTQSETESISNLKAWLKKHKLERDFLAAYSSQAKREVGNIPRSSEKSETEIRQNLFELLSIRTQQKQPPTNPSKS